MGLMGRNHGADPQSKSVTGLSCSSNGHVGAGGCREAKNGDPVSDLTYQVVETPIEAASTAARVERDRRQCAKQSSDGAEAEQAERAG